MKYLYLSIVVFLFSVENFKAQSWQDCFLGAETSDDFYNCLYGCFPLEANTECGAIYLCQDEKYSFCKCRGGYNLSSLRTVLPERVFTFDVNEIGQSISIDLEGQTWGASSITLVGPYTFESSCDNLEQVNSSNFINLLSEDPSGGGASLMNINLPNDFGKYYIVFSGHGFYYGGSGGNAEQYPCTDLNLNITFSPEKHCVTSPCETCIGSFAPIPNGDYLVGTWVKEDGASPTKTSYTYPELSVICQTSGGQVTFGPFQAQGEIIDGWQRIEEQIHIPLDATNIQIVLASTSGDVFYDDVRMFPFDASMKTYVYDPVNMRLAAELDERHYATFYEYDEEGKLVRIKKETEKGVMTIQETKSNSSKKDEISN